MKWINFIVLALCWQSCWYHCQNPLVSVSELFSAVMALQPAIWCVQSRTEMWHWSMVNQSVSKWRAVKCPGVWKPVMMLSLTGFFDGCRCAIAWCAIVRCFNGAVIVLHLELEQFSLYASSSVLVCTDVLDICGCYPLFQLSIHSSFSPSIQPSICCPLSSHPSIHPSSHPSVHPSLLPIHSSIHYTAACILILLSLILSACMLVHTLYWTAHMKLYSGVAC